MADMKVIHARAHSASDPGKYRSRNEDRHFSTVRTPSDAIPIQLIMAVCDGMGGHAAGNIASQYAVNAVKNLLLNSPPLAMPRKLAQRVARAVGKANLVIHTQATKDLRFEGMGTTATVCASMGEDLFIGNVGDSRAYILRGGRLVLVTHDHSLVNHLLAVGQLTPQQASTFPLHHVITRSLGKKPTVSVDLTHVALKRGDKLLLCSDGLTGPVTEDAIRDTLIATDDPMEACTALIKLANDARGPDNITAGVAIFDGDGLMMPTDGDIRSLCREVYIA